MSALSTLRTLAKEHSVPSMIEKDGVPTLTDLRHAFEQFSEASARLEHRYGLLCRETEELRGKLKAKEAEIERSARLATLGQMAAALAHEIRNPLGALKIFLSLIREDTKKMPLTFPVVEQAGSSIVALENVVSNMLHFAKPKLHLQSIINLSSVIRTVVERAKITAPEQMVFEVKTLGAVFLHGAESSLAQAFTNLIQNAVQSCGDKGRIQVSIEQRQDHYEVSVEDTGRGIPLEVFSRLFEPFVTSKEQGTGLGLAVVKQIVVQHGGAVRAENLDSGGARFSVSLPKRPAVAAS